MKPTAVLDIGSSKVVCLYGKIADRDGILVSGVGVASCESYLGDEWIDRQGLHDAIIEVIQRAEQEANSRFREVVLTVPTAFSKVVLSDITVSFGGRPRTVEQSDIDALLEASVKKVPHPEEMQLINSTPVFFLVDGVSSAESPIETETEELSALVSHIFVKKDFVETIQDILDDIGVEFSMFINAMHGEALMLIPEQERVRPAVLIDVGYRQTDICVVEGTAITALSSIPVGGYQFASDLAFGLEVTQESAEQAKRRFVFSLDYGDRTEILRTDTESKRVSLDTIAYIIEARAAELSELIREELEHMDVNLSARPVIYLAGGGLLMMRGSLEFLKKQLALPIKRDMPWTPRLSSPNYCSAFGALYFALRFSHPEETASAAASEERPSIWNLLKNFFTK